MIRVKRDRESIRTIPNALDIAEAVSMQLGQLRGIARRTVSWRRALGMAVFSVAACSGIAFGAAKHLTNADIVRLTEAGVSETTIVAMIESAGATEFDTTVDAIVSMAEAGVGDNVIEAVVSIRREPGIGEELEAQFPISMVEIDRNELGLIRDALVAGDYGRVLSRLDAYLASAGDHKAAPLAHYIYALAVWRTNGDAELGFHHANAFLRRTAPGSHDREHATELLRYLEGKRIEQRRARQYSVGKVVAAQRREPFGYVVATASLARPDRLRRADTLYLVSDMDDGSNIEVPVDILRHNDKEVVVAVAANTAASDYVGITVFARYTDESSFP